VVVHGNHSYTQQKSLLYLEYDYFKQTISDKIDRQIEPQQRGGDRRSDKFKNKTNFYRVWPYCSIDSM